MADGELSARADDVHQDEFGDLAKSFNQMANRVETKVEELRRFVSDAVHELHTPLTALRTNLELINDDIAQQKESNHFSQALAQLDRMDTLTRNLLKLSRLKATDVVHQLEVWTWEKLYVHWGNPLHPKLSKLILPS